MIWLIGLAVWIVWVLVIVFLLPQSYWDYMERRLKEEGRWYREED